MLIALSMLLIATATALGEVNARRGFRGLTALVILGSPHRLLTGAR